MKFLEGIRSLGTGIAVSLALSGCAYQRPAEVTAQIARAESSIRQAEQSGAEQGALPELQAAKDKFADAQRALEKKDQKNDAIALQLAQQAQLDAQYAAAKSQSKQQQQAAQEVRSGVDSLREEAAREVK